MILVDVARLLLQSRHLTGHVLVLLPQLARSLLLSGQLAAKGLHFFLSRIHQHALLAHYGEFVLHQRDATLQRVLMGLSQRHLLLEFHDFLLQGRPIGAGLAGKFSLDLDVALALPRSVVELRSKRVDRPFVVVHAFGEAPHPYLLIIVKTLLFLERCDDTLVRLDPCTKHLLHLRALNKSRVHIVHRATSVGTDRGIRGRRRLRVCAGCGGRSASRRRRSVGKARLRRTRCLWHSRPRGRRQGVGAHDRGGISTARGHISMRRRDLRWWPAK
mmetsp:Transcript_13411/g.36085  ORF Transcript_13411/g.36085 Transcript_13411/m.36085 type:complete len:273 (-) Transcript_13411:650-1468(-)